VGAETTRAAAQEDDVGRARRVYFVGHHGFEDGGSAEVKRTVGVGVPGTVVEVRRAIMLCVGWLVYEEALDGVALERSWWLRGRGVGCE
jgi:hypothetical protein